MNGELSPVSGGAGLHAGLPIILGGVPLAGATSAMVVLHGRGGRGTDLLEVGRRVAGPHAALFAPEAFHGTWYPQRFTAPNQANEPYLGSAISVIDDLVRRLTDGGVPAARIMLLGFSQGACLALECAARNGTRVGSVFAFSGGLIGDVVDPQRYRRQGGTEMLLCCAEQDSHIPIDRVRRSAVVLRQIGAHVRLRTWRGSEHGIRDSDIEEAAVMEFERRSPALQAG